MSNERLRAAIAKAGLELEQLAEIVQVDSKTVERWIAGRIPYTRHRTRVAKALGADPHELWPQAQPAVRTPIDEPGEQGDLLAAYPSGEAPGVPDWQILLTGPRDRIDMLDTTLLDVVSVEGVIELLAAKAAAGCQIRILLANSPTPTANGYCASIRPWRWTGRIPPPCWSRRSTMRAST